MMRQMKDSGVEWMGQIPEKWKVQRAKTLFLQRLTKGNQYTVLLAATQKHGMLPQSEVEGVVQVKEDADLQQFRTVHKNDFVISLRSFQGGFEFSQYEGVCSPAYQVFYSTKPICYSYYRMLFKSDGFIKKMNSLTVGIRDGKNIQYDDFANSLVPVPPLKEQEHIADYLDRKCAEIDAIIAKQQQIIEKLKEYKLSIITEAVTKGLDPNVPMKDSGVKWIGKIPEHWNILKLQAHTRMLTPMRDRPEKLDGDIPWVRIEDYDGKYISTSKEGLGVSLETVNEMNLKIYPVGSILCTSSCDLGKCAIVTRELVSNQRFINIIPDLDTNSDYLYYLMLSNAKRLNHLSTGTIQANLSRKAFEHLMVQFPPFAEQKEIAEYLDKKCETVELSIRKKQELIDRLNLYKKSLIYETVTGKKEI